VPFYPYTAKLKLISPLSAAYDLHYNVHKVYVCVACDNKEFKARKHYRSHMERIHKVEGERPRLYKCDICFKTFKDKFVLNTHMTTHSNIKKYTCPYENVCQYSTNNKTYLSYHVLNHTNRLRKCYICYRGFKSEEEVQKHIKKLHDNEPILHKCECGKLATSKGNLRQHQRTHQNPVNGPQLKCPECPKTFSLQCRLKKHQLSHKGQNKLSCSICSKLLSKDSYKKHLKGHRGEKPFLCDVCGDCFTTNSCLTTHRRSHSVPVQENKVIHNLHGTGKLEATAHCELCDKPFSDPASLLEHRNSHHAPDRSFLFISY